MSNKLVTLPPVPAALLKKHPDAGKIISDAQESLSKLSEKIEELDSGIIKMAGRALIHASVGFFNLIIRAAVKEAEKGA